jgi:hypothetical protein
MKQRDGRDDRSVPGSTPHEAVERQCGTLPAFTPSA